MREATALPAVLYDSASRWGGSWWKSLKRQRFTWGCQQGELAL